MIPQKPSTRRTETASMVLLGIPKKGEELRPRAPTLVVPIESAVARVKAKSGDLTIDRASLLVAPAGARLLIRPSSTIIRVAAVSFHEPLFQRVVRTYAKLGMERARLDRWMTEEALLPRTVWVHEVVHRYVFERHALGEENNEATRFLEMEILKEVYYLFRDRDEGADRASIQRKCSPPVERAIAYLEAHLFEACSAGALARHARSSESTLLRAFRRELGCTPAAYWRQRKLDGALDLLRAGRNSVAEVAEAVGYENATAFGYAFRLRFGRPPSFYRPRDRLRPAP